MNVICFFFVIYRFKNDFLVTLNINVNFFKDLNTALDEALESFDLASTNWLEGKGGRQQQQQPADGVKK